MIKRLVSSYLTDLSENQGHTVLLFFTGSLQRQKKQKPTNKTKQKKRKDKNKKAKKQNKNKQKKKETKWGTTGP